MVNGNIDAALNEALLSGSQVKRDEYMLTTLHEVRKDQREIKATVADIKRNCPRCKDGLEMQQVQHEADSDGRRVWFMWSVGAGLVKGLALPLVVCAISTLFTLAVTGQL
jgi:hypothetical protein